MSDSCTLNSPSRALTGHRLRIVLATVAINIAGVIVFAMLPWSDWRTGVALNLLDNAILIGYALWRRDRLMGHFLVFGLLVGFVELAADAWLVDGTRTLDYSICGGPMIWRSPLWMPMAWEIVAVQFGVIGGFLFERFKWLGLLLAGFLGAVNIPFYEEMALRTNWWRYVNCRMLLHTPYYIIVGEFGIVLALAWLGRGLRCLEWRKTVLAGVLGGLSTFVAYLIAYDLIEPH